MRVHPGGELAKLGIRVSATKIRTLLQRAGLGPAPRRGAHLELVVQLTMLAHTGRGADTGSGTPRPGSPPPAPTSSNAVYDAANRLTSWNGGTLNYDLAGNLTQDGTQTFTWNARGQLTATSPGSASFAYDAFGRLSSSTISGTTRSYVYDRWNAVQEKDGTGAVFANSIFGLGLDDVFWRKPVAGSASSYLGDALGSTVALVDGTGASTTTYTYEPYGKPTAGDLSNPFTFTGREWDGTVSLQLNRARYYSPGHGRFISEDPIGEAGGVDLYGYARSSPTTRTDPLGLEPRNYTPENFEFQPAPPLYAYEFAESDVSFGEALVYTGLTLWGFATGAATFGSIGYVVAGTVGAVVGGVLGGLLVGGLVGTAILEAFI